MSFKVMVENISAQNINKYESFNPRYITLATPVKEEKNDTVEISDENNVKPDKKNRKIQNFTSFDTVFSIPDSEGGAGGNGSAFRFRVQ